MPLDLTSPEAQEALSLSQTKAGKLLVAAVRASQGRSRATWAPDKRPPWWKERVVLTMPDGERVTTLPFGSKDKMNWGATATKVTYVMYLFRDDLGAIGEGDAPQGEAPQAAESPKLVKVRHEEERSKVVEVREEERPRRRKPGKRKPPKMNREPASRRRKAAPSLAHPVSEQGDAPAHQLETPSAAESAEEVRMNTRRRKRVRDADDVILVQETEVASRTRPRRAKKKPPLQPVRRRNPRRGKAQPVVAIVVSDDEDDNASTGPQSPRAPVSRRRVASHARDVADEEMHGEGGERATEEQDAKNVDLERENAARVAAIVAEQAKFNENVKNALAEFRQKAKRKRLSMERNYEKQKTALASAFGVIKLKNYPQRVLDMAMSEYVTKYNGDAHERLMKDTIRHVELVLGEQDMSDEPHPFAHPARTPHDQARRDKVTATARKAKRAVRDKQKEFAVPKTSMRARPQRSAAKTATTRTKAILQGSAIRRPAQQRVGRTRRGPVVPPVTPAMRQAHARERNVVNSLLATIQKQPDPQATMKALMAMAKEGL